MFDETALNSEDYKHFELFYLLIPALTTSFVDSFMQAKNTLKTKNMTKVYFCDDGFAVGIAYILKILRQNDRFSGINWFKSVIEKHSLDKPTKLQAASADRMRKVVSEAYLKEFEWLFYSFVAAQRYFKDE